jgi:hypothetical protein
MKIRKEIKHYKYNKMTGNTTYLLIKTLHINDLNSPVKTIDWWIGLKKNT